MTTRGLPIVLLTGVQHPRITFPVQHIQYRHSQLFVSSSDTLFRVTSDDLWPDLTDASGIRQFAISPHGDIVVWTANGTLWFSGEKCDYWEVIHREYPDTGQLVLVNSQWLIGQSSLSIYKAATQHHSTKSVVTGSDILCLVCDAKYLYIGFAGSIGILPLCTFEAISYVSPSTPTLHQPIHPVSIALHADEIYVADSANQCIFAMSPSGTVRQSLSMNIRPDTRIAISSTAEMSILQEGKTMVRSKFAEFLRGSLCPRSSVAKCMQKPLFEPQLWRLLLSYVQPVRSRKHARTDD